MAIAQLLYYSKVVTASVCLSVCINLSLFPGCLVESCQFIFFSFFSECRGLLVCIAACLHGHLLSSCYLVEVGQHVSSKLCR